MISCFDAYFPVVLRTIKIPTQLQNAKFEHETSSFCLTKPIKAVTVQKRNQTQRWI